MKYTIEVTEQDITHGKRKQCEECPIALAMHRATDEHWSVGTKLDRCRDGFSIKTPLSACEFITDFDSSLPVQPFTFEIETP